MNRLNKIKYSILLGLLFLLHYSRPAFADDFRTNLLATYNIDEKANATVIFRYSLENLKSEILAKEFHINFTHLKPQNLKVSQEGKEIQYEITQEQNSLYLKIKFSDDMYGVGKKRVFDIQFNEANISKKTGNIVEVSIPKINADDIDNYDSILTIPRSVGPTAYITPSKYEVNQSEDSYTYKFSGKTAQENGISAAFGEFQVFDYILNYNLENPNTKSTLTPIAFPPDTPYQKVYITNIEPTPFSAQKDDDGNWIYYFKLSALEKKTIKVEGSVQLFSNPRSLTIPTPQSIIKNLGTTSYWQTDSEAIKTLSSQLKTPFEIYQYVVTNLKYDFDRVNPSAERLGALKALENSQNALCTEFTDTFVAVARSAGIPAREVQGYAYTENGKLQPLSLVTDVLHSWPEYWDNEKKTWIAVDPTWESTTGIDYFNKFDLNHFAFVVHGVNDSEPLPAGSYKFSNSPKKDVYIKYGHVPSNADSQIRISSSLTQKYNPFVKKIKLVIENAGQQADYHADLKIYRGSSQIPYETSYIESLIPHEKYEKEIPVSYGLLGKNAPDKITILYNDKEYVVSTDKDMAVVSQIAVFLTSIFIIVVAIFISHKRSNA